MTASSRFSRGCLRRNAFVYTKSRVAALFNAVVSLSVLSAE